MTGMEHAERGQDCDRKEADEFISTLSNDDVAALRRLIAIYRSISGWCRVNRWLAMFVIGAIIAIAQSIDAIKSILGIKAH